MVISLHSLRRAGTLAAAALLSTAAPAAAHGTAPHQLSERQLRAFETEVLGPRHAAEHAQQRRLARDAARHPRRRVRARKADLPAVDPALGGQWDQPFPLPTLGVHATLLPTGKVLFFAYPRRPTVKAEEENWTKAYLFDPTTGATKEVRPPKYRDPKTGQLTDANLWCGGQSLLADGQVLVTGGNLAYEDPPYYYKGLNKAYTFDPWKEKWTEQPDMRHGRWYPSQVLMADGQTLVMGGYDEGQHRQYDVQGLNKQIELFTQPPKVGGRGRWTLLGEEGEGSDEDGKPFINELYPHLFAMPSGRVLVAGPHHAADTWLIDQPGAFPTLNWTEVPDFKDNRYYGNGLLMPGTPKAGNTKVMLIGGTNIGGDNIAVKTAEVVDETRKNAGWKPAASWNIARSHANTVQLPDGSMVTIGGGKGVNERLYDYSDEQRQVELYDPISRTWTLGAAQAEGRAYHSTAVLLPDGRVISAGDDFNGGNEADTAEVYSPPYLFKGPRPVIDAAPKAVAFGDKLSVNVSNSPAARAVLVAPGATTHAADMSQRIVPLAGTPRADGGIDLTAPADGNITPPGYYMLFVLNAAGVPSVASWVKLGDAPPPPVVKDYAANRRTIWKSSGKKGASWTLDLGRVRPLERVALRWGKYPPEHYIVSGSKDKKKFRFLGDNWPYKPYWETTRFDEHDVRYVRVTIRKHFGKRPASLLDVKAYG